MPSIKLRLDRLENRAGRDFQAALREMPAEVLEAHLRSLTLADWARVLAEVEATGVAEDVELIRAGVLEFGLGGKP